ncbi:MAG: long-chain fatty acid--CoA ligase [Acidobacteria bacterium]|nr:long-chain fatty acid--CoA ligase [Acidobacteriota bacterium]
MFLQRVAATPDAPAFLHPVGDAWKTLTWKETAERVRAISNGLLSLGLKPEERGAILASTRLDWFLADFGLVCAGGVTTTIYPASTADECSYILIDCDAVVAFVEDQTQLAKLTSRKADLKGVKHVIVFDGSGTADGWAITLADLEARGAEFAAKNPGAFEAAAKHPGLSSLATLIYTSGTTGKPKGVELTHGCWVYEGTAVQKLNILSPADLQFFWLPLAHVFGKVIGAAQLVVGFPTAVDGRVDKLVENLKAVKPTFVCAVPRIFEKVYNKVLGQAQTTGGLKYEIFKWAIGVGKEVSALGQQGKQPGFLLGLKRSLAEKLVFKKVQATFGGRLRFFISGSAPLSKEIAVFFDAMGLTILEGYGLTESSAGTFLNLPGACKFGTVGRPLPGTQVKIAADGEILIKGGGVMRCYHGMPEATAEMLDADGWLHTGDIGELDADGFLKITDRKKDLIKTSGGKYVAPQHLEGQLILQSRYIAQAVVHGNNRNFVTALITISELEIRPWAQEAGLGDTPLPELVNHEKVRALIEEAINGVNARLAKHETIKRFAILPSEFTVESGELTPSMKLKRKVVEQRYATVLEGFYEGSLKEM